eukprot:CAMPEP_0182434944 /NCGR_PEP_ID=MMETSP1167-20130531/72727_1 /TAXON_ID=2988 /ORGANISM="Mallomonas Sp, Strain CCMP3275" /LENGTH=498 /DNA_ID=CAMNT_0024625395 /DNA_START=15 /DNA_END=1508 /DNA_ORIENTATION=-
MSSNMNRNTIKSQSNTGKTAKQMQAKSVPHVTRSTSIGSADDEISDNESKANYKTIMCRYGKNCMFGDRCSFAHNESELRTFNTTARSFTNSNASSADPSEVLQVNALPPKPFIMQAEDFPQLSNKAKPSIEISKDHNETSDQRSNDNHTQTHSRNSSLTNSIQQPIIIENELLSNGNYNEYINDHDIIGNQNWGNGNISELSVSAVGSTSNFGYLSSSLLSSTHQNVTALQQHHELVNGLSNDSLGSSYFSSLLPPSIDIHLNQDTNHPNNNTNTNTFSLSSINNDLDPIISTVSSSVLNSLSISDPLQTLSDTPYYHFISSSSSLHSSSIPITSNSSTPTSITPLHNQSHMNNNIPINPSTGIDADIVPPKTFPTVDWLRNHNMSMYLWSGNEHAWTEFAMHIPSLYIEQIKYVLPGLIYRSGCQMWIDYDYLESTYESFLVMRRGENGDPANMAMVRALQGLSSFLSELLFPKKTKDDSLVSGGSLSLSVDEIST